MRAVVAGHPRSLVALLLAVLGLAGVAACAGSAGTDQPLDPTGAIVLDVRTPAEYADGHLEGALNIDVQDPQVFAAGVGDLDPAGRYIVYCRTGNRSGMAIAQMQDLGFDDLTNAGGLQEAAEATGLPIVTS